MGASFSSLTADGCGGARIGDMSPREGQDERLKCYDKFKSLPVIIEGPEFNKDFSYFL